LVGQLNAFGAGHSPSPVAMLQMITARGRWPAFTAAMVGSPTYCCIGEFIGIT
jgi:hypothetical protein